MTIETADRLIDEILKVFEESDIPITSRLTLFSRIQNIIYREFVGD